MKRTLFPAVGEELYQATLPNGLRIMVDRKPGYARSYAVFGTRYGGADRRFRYDGQWLDTPAGIAHFLEHKMFDMPDGANVMGEFSARGASPNAFTATDMTAYYFGCTECFEENLRTLLKFVSTPYYTPESVQKEQGIIAQEILMGYDNPFYTGYFNLMKALYAVHPVRESIAGTVESIAGITDETLYRCHKIFYNPSNMILTVVGDVEPELVERLARELLPAEPGEVPERDYGSEESILPSQAFSQQEMAVSAPQFFLGARMELPADGKERMKQKVLGDLALDYLCGTASPFYNRLYADGLLNRSFGAEIDISADTACAFLCGESRDPRAVQAALSEEIRTIACSGLNRKQFERCLRSQYGAALSGLGDFKELAVSLMEDGFHGWNALDTFDVLPKLTADEVASFLCAAFSPEKLAMSVISPPSHA